MRQVPTTVDPLDLPPRAAAGRLVVELPIARLATTLAPLRGPRTDPASPLAPLPLRVAATGDGTYEVLDGFKLRRSPETPGVCSSEVTHRR